MANILLVDIETAPNIAYVWGAWKQNVAVKQMIRSTYIMSIAWKWLDHPALWYTENRYDNDKDIVKTAISIFDEADVVIAHNAVKFDIPVIQARAVVHGITPPSPFKTICTYKAAKKHFRFPMYSLEYLAKAFGCTEKESHKEFPGFELWLECLRQNDRAWAEMQKYNKQDVLTLEELYLKMRPWIQPHPNLSNLIDTDKPMCPRCESEDIQKRGFYHTQTMKYQRYRCNSCGSWSRERFSARKLGDRKEMLNGV